MGVPRPDFRQTWLWQHVFVTPRQGIRHEEQEYFRDAILAMREKVEHLVGRISDQMPGLTVHDLSHLDALWGTASIVAEGAVTVTPAEGFVLGAAILVHDSAMTVAAYQNGLAEIRQTVEWKDSYARWKPKSVPVNAEGEGDSDAVRHVLPDVLRRLHAKQAAVIVERPWKSADGEPIYLIEDSDLRNFYAKTIGEIAQSHWWTVTKVESELSQDLGAYAARTSSVIDRVKLACLLRIADSLHLDQRRAPRFLRMLLKPAGHSALHWDFQERLAHPHVEADTVVFTAGRPFKREEADAWWLAYDTLNYVDRELSQVETLLRSRGRELFKARRVKGAGSPEALSKMVGTEDWRPVDARLKVTDVPRIVESLGGAKLYGNDPRVPLRELIQNAADAIQARRKIQNRNAGWGEITICIRTDGDAEWLVVEDNGIGMSEVVLTGPLLDFGTSFWRSPLIMDEFPGLVAAGMEPIGRFGIGFFSVFMLGDTVRVTSRRYDRGEETARTLEVRGGPSGRPMLSTTPRGDAPLDGGTRVEVLLKTRSQNEGGLLKSKGNSDTLSLDRVSAALAPSLNVKIVVGGQNNPCTVVEPNDWLEIPSADLLDRLNLTSAKSTSGKSNTLLRTLSDSSGASYGRAAIAPSRYAWSQSPGWVTVFGLKANQLWNVKGILAGEATTAARNIAIPLVPKDVLACWATEQATLIAESKMDDERKARAAETVLECSGEIGSLPIVRWAGRWLTAAQFASQINEHTELLVDFDGEVTYDEDEDEVHPREFKEDFTEAETVVFVPKHNGGIIREDGVTWPTNQNRAFSTTNLAQLVRSLIEDAWRGCDESEERRVVGSVGNTSIWRTITEFLKHDASE